MWGDGEQTRSFCYIEDCLEGIYRLMRSAHTSPLNLGSDRMVTINELAQIIAKIAGIQITIKHIPGPMAYAAAIRIIPACARCSNGNHVSPLRKASSAPIPGSSSRWLRNWAWIASRMAFLTIFTAPKPFTNPHIAVIQRNAIQSWKCLPDVDVILIGDEAGIPEAAKDLDVTNVAEVNRDEKGIPQVSAVMEIGHKHSDSPILCYANADMILMSDLLKAARRVSQMAKDFLLVGQRWDLDQSDLLDFSGDWESRLRLDVAQRGRFYSPWGIDYFVFPRHLYTNVPNFTIGRPAWDNWMVYHARTTFGMAIDASRDVLVIHQNHDYSHLPGQQAALWLGGRQIEPGQGRRPEARLQHPGYQP